METFYLDSCIVIYLVERHPQFAPLIEHQLETAGDIVLAISPLVRLEVLVKPMQARDNILQNRYEHFLSTQKVLTISEAVFEQALLLRVAHHLRTPDALHLATAEYHGCQAFWTNDRRLSAISKIAINITELN